jgi:hypothetical protein
MATRRNVPIKLIFSSFSWQLALDERVGSQHIPSVGGRDERPAQEG